MNIRKKRAKTNYNRIVDLEWNKLFDKYNILKEINNKGYFNITSKQINEFKEARLMTKFDYEDNLPDLFYDNDLSILPTTRGSYIIGEFNAYEPVKYQNIECRKVSFPNWIQSIDYKNLYSESNVLHCADVTGILQDVLGEDIKQTISGRMSTSVFKFKIQGVNNYREIENDSSQCEIDGGYESLNKLMIIEAKNFTTKDFLIRQLYYPYRLWRNKIKKEIVPVFLTYSNDIFSFFIYRFKDDNIYNSLELIGQKNYVIEEDEIELADIIKVLNSVKSYTLEPEIPFPQADSFERVVDLLGILTEKDEISIDDISLNYAFNKRQAQYYSRAAMYLGLVESVNRGSVQLSKIGRMVMSKRGKDKNLSIAKCILSYKTFNEVLTKYFENYEPVSLSEISKIMQNNNLYGIDSISTFNRRAQTVRSWVDWILDLQY